MEWDAKFFINHATPYIEEGERGGRGGGEGGRGEGGGRGGGGGRSRSSVIHVTDE